MEILFWSELASSWSGRWRGRGLPCGAQMKALEEEEAESESTASELWREMPELAREHEASRGDDGLGA